MFHTLKEYIDTYNPEYIQLIIGEHLININTFAEGSLLVIRAFESERFIFKTLNDTLLILSSV